MEYKKGEIKGEIPQKRERKERRKEGIPDGKLPNINKIRYKTKEERMKNIMKKEGQKGRGSVNIQKYMDVFEGKNIQGWSSSLERGKQMVNEAE